MGLVEVGVISSLLLGGLGLAQQQQTRSDTKRAAAKAAEASAITTEEKKKELKSALDKRQATARARAAASGVSGASTDIYLSALEKEGADELSYLSKVGDAEYNKTIAEGNLSVGKASSAFWGSAGNLLNDFSSANEKFKWF